MTDWSGHYAARAQRMAASEIRELLKLLDQPDIISFAGGIPDPALFPRAEIAQSFERILNDPEKSAVALQYSVSEGYPPLRAWIAGYMGRQGVACRPDNILITNGSQQALDFLGKLFLSPNDTVLVQRPTYLGALQAFNSYEPHYDILPSLDSNRTPESFHSEAKSNGAGARVKIGYVMSEFQNPTGVSLTLAERNALLDSAAALGIPLIEDTAYEKMRYDGEALPSMLALAATRAGGIDQANVIYCGTFSKTIVPALRIGWVVAPQPVIQKLVLIKQASDLHSSTLNQMVMHEVASTILDAQVVRIKAAYRERRDAMLAALARHLPAGVDWTKPEGGMFVWLTLPEAIDGATLLARAIAEARVAFVPGSAFFPDRAGHNTIRLSFSRANPAAIEEGIKRLGTVIKASL